MKNSTQKKAVRNSYEILKELKEKNLQLKQQIEKLLTQFSNG